jgi:4-amino-4-deoxy-L-arabinose transferase-like glycosyltransferase
LCIFFFCAGHAFIPLLGIEDDEALFAQGIFSPRAELYSIHIGRSNIPIMLMSYLGALKSIVLRPVLVTFGVSLRTVREPMLLAGVASLWLFFLLLRRTAGDRAAYIGCALLACDSLYLLTTCFDWGPVALQHLLLLGGALALARFFHTRGNAALFGSGVLFGLALWDKALAVWMLSGLGLGGILIFPRQIIQLVTLRRASIFLLALVIGAMPLILYNMTSKGGTLEGNFQKNTAEIPQKGLFLINTLSGDGLFGWMTDEDWHTPQPHPPQGAIGRASAAISAVFDHPRHSLFFYAFVLALLAAPFAGATQFRLILWALIALLVAWIQMAMNQNTGGSVHHTILLWPLPQFIVATSFAGVSQRFGRAGIRAVAAITVVVALSMALVTNEYYFMMARDGGAKSWTDAIFPLSQYLRRQPPTTWAFALDWGIMDQLRLLERGKLHVGIGTDQISKPEMTPEDKTYVRAIVADPASVFIAHTKDFEFFPGNLEKLTQLAAESGYRRETLATIPDSFGRTVYEVYRFVK